MHRANSFFSSVSSVLGVSLLLIFSLFSHCNMTDYVDFETASAALSARFDVVEINAAEFLQTHQGRANTVLIDVRTAEEQSVSIIPGALLATPQTKLHTLPEVRDAAADATIVVYCAGGYRSARSISKSSEIAAQRMVNLRGGIVGYANAGGKLVDAQGAITHKVHGYNSTWAGYVEAPNEGVVEPPVP